MMRNPEYLEWDSKFFGKRIGRLDLRHETSPKIDVSDLDLLYVYSEEDGLFELKGFTCSYAEVKVVFSKTNFESHSKSMGNVVSVFNSELKPEDIYELAFDSGHESRFRKDPNFEESEFKAMYRKWIDNSFSKSMADDLLICFDEGVLKGFVSYKVRDDHAVIGLIAVDERSKGHGIGAQLIQAVEDIMVQQNIAELRIPTQLGNDGAMRFYSALGYKEIERIQLKHYWKNDTI